VGCKNLAATIFCGGRSALSDDNESKIEGGSYQYDELTFIELLRVITSYRITILGVTVVCIVLAGLAAFLLPPVYRAEVIIAAADENSSSGGLSSIMSRFSGFASMGGLSGLGRRDKTTQAVVSLGSPKFTREFIRDNNLLPVFFADSWDADAGKWNVNSPGDIPTLADGFEIFDEKIRKIEEDDNGVVTMSIEWTDPDQAAGWANELVQRLNDKLRTRAIDEANQTIDYLNKELEKTRTVEVQQAIYFMIENQINARTMANVRSEFSFKVISPAIAPDDDRFVSPNRPLLFFIGIFGGLVLGIFISFFAFAVGRIRKEMAD
jgi:uncharacterized protein involved in exopolysaccharide biosynthesis